MSKKLYVGNLPFSATEEALHELFSQYGSIESVKLVTDRDTGRPRGFGFVEMADGASEAIAALNDREFGGRNLKVNEAKPREGGGGGGGRGGGGGGGRRNW
ncbi:MAG: RNA-binding protein [Candidatus Eisenbacteria bacterium]|uniref:RNA-binding protein n=1 Tax=Eiseniibacteriota bacterium TaxID=2212470 RepID=A0A948RZR7_UNCEI|nr:RNA-binding protein [Candidatus Eisenbacteria bacterium]MBU1949045.1 RNA-binding protein [Candidatus Eisenbacteria bacterium]MBU2692627.1 RNA-binding protein [Candidatus Eisenbacteria bacterium]